jgi:hypothetical protein
MPGRLAPWALPAAPGLRKKRILNHNLGVPMDKPKDALGDRIPLLWPEIIQALGEILPATLEVVEEKPAFHGPFS